MSQELSDRPMMDRSARKRVSGRSSRFHSTRYSAKEDDLTAARSKLDSILDSIARGEETFEDDYFDEETNGLTSPVKSKRSRGPRKTRKRTRDDEYSKSSVFILKLFDRTVDLSEFCTKYIDRDPPLYPICRAWARNSDTANDKNSVEEDQSAVNELETMGYGASEKSTGVHVLPDPIPRPVDDNGNEIDLRIPENAKIKKGPAITLIDDSINSMTEKGRESLLDCNLSKWKTVRQEWREAAARNQARYKPSFTVIKALSTVPSQALDEEMLSTM